MARPTLDPERPRGLRRYHLADLLAAVALIVGLLAMVTLFVWAFTTTCFDNTPTCVAMHTVWTPLTWALTCGLMAIVGLVGAVLQGLILCVAPARLVRPSAASVVQHWPRPAGVALAWLGICIMGLAVFIVLHNPLDPTMWPAGMSPMPAFAIFSAVAIGPLVALTLLEVLLRRVWHRQP